MSDLILRPDGEIAYPNDNAKVIELHHDGNGFDLNAFLGNFSQCLNAGDLISKIKVGTQYVVHVPSAALKEGMEAGKYVLNQNSKNGILWPSLVEIDPNGKRQFVANLPIKEQSIIQGNPLQNVSQSLYNAAIQAQLSEIKKIAQTTLTNTKKILQGQKDDRIGHLQAGYERFMFAMQEKDPVEKNKGLNDALNILLIARGEIGSALRSAINDFEPIPDGWLSRSWTRWHFDGNYYETKDNAIDEIQDYYEMYLHATTAIAACYYLAGKQELSEIVFQQGIDFLNGLNFKPLGSIKYAHPNKDLSDKFFNLPTSYMRTEQRIFLQEAKMYDYIAIPMTGDKILEVLSDGRSEQISE